LAATGKSIDLGPVAGREYKDFIQALDVRFLENAGILFLVNSKQPPDRGIRFFIIDPGYKEV
jgi:hypothetical protein